MTIPPSMMTLLGMGFSVFSLSQREREPALPVTASQ